MNKVYPDAKAALRFRSSTLDAYNALYIVLQVIDVKLDLERGDLVTLDQFRDVSNNFVHPTLRMTFVRSFGVHFSSD